MGGKNPIKQIAQLAVESFVPGGSGAVRIAEGAANAAGAQGIADATKDITDTTGAVGDSIVDQASGDAKKRSEKAQVEQKAAENTAAQQADTEKKRLAGIENEKRESNRMSAGSKSRTLLTGPAGLEDEDGKKSISRRTLAAR